MIVEQWEAVPMRLRDPHILSHPEVYRDHHEHWYLHPNTKRTMLCRFRFKEGEPSPPLGLEVESVQFGGDYTNVRYHVTKAVRLRADLFFPDAVFEQYRNELAYFLQYREGIIDKLRGRS